MSTSPTLVTEVRVATKYGSSASASAGPVASTCHQMAWPPVAHDAIAGRRRSELSCPLKDAKTTPHSSGSCRWWRRKQGMQQACRPHGAPTSGLHPDPAP